MLQKMLIIGGSGLIGSTLAEYAMSYFQMHLTYNETNIPQKNIPTTKIDLLKDRKSIIELIKNFKPDVVIHTAAYPSVDFCQLHTNMAELLHVDITNDIADICNRIDSKLIYFSTDAVFDGRLDRKYLEDDAPNPISYYGKTKLKAEKIVLQTSNLNVVLRTTVVYGWHKRSRFTNWVLDTLRGKKKITAFTDQHNTPTLVDDLAKVILKIIEMKISGLYHAVGKTCLSRYQFALKLADKFNLDGSFVIPTISENKQEAPRPSNGCLDNQKLELKTGYSFCDIDTGISHIFDKSLYKFSNYL